MNKILYNIIICPGLLFAVDIKQSLTLLAESLSVLTKYTFIAPQTNPIPIVLPKKYYAAGALPYYIDKKNKRLLILLGYEWRNNAKTNVWTDFNGGRDPGETNPLFTAQREMYEEAAQTIDLDFMSIKKLYPPLGKIEPVSIKNIASPAGSDPDKNYVHYLLPITSHPAYTMEILINNPVPFKLNADALVAKFGKHGAHVEKTNWAWVDAQDLLTIAGTVYRKNQAAAAGLHIPTISGTAQSSSQKTINSLHFSFLNGIANNQNTRAELVRLTTIAQQ